MSRGDHIKLIGEPEQVSQPAFPHTSIQFGPLSGGFAISILFADDIAFTKAFTQQAEDDLCTMLLQRRKQRREQLAVVQHINQTKG